MLKVLLDELVKVTTLAVLEVHKVPFLLNTLNINWLISLKTRNLNDVWVSLQNLRNLKLNFSVENLIFILEWLEDFETLSLATVG